MDTHHMDKKFDNTLEVVGSEFGDLQAKKEQFIAQNRATYRIQPVVPRNIPGLTPRTEARLPSAVAWWKKTTSFERNGFFNIHTPMFNTRIIPISFFVTILWGNVQYVWDGVYQEEHYDNFEPRNTLYDKLSHRDLPLARIWQRPG